MLSSKILDALVGLMSAWGLVLILHLFAALVKVIMVVSMMIQFGLGYAINDNGLDPNTGVQFAQEAVTSFASILPVSNGTSPDPSIPSLNSVTQPQQLAFYLGPDLQNPGYDRLAVDYMLQIPVPYLPFIKTQLYITTPLFFQLDFYQTW